MNNHSTSPRTLDFLGQGKGESFWRKVGLVWFGIIFFINFSGFGQPLATQDFEGSFLPTSWTSGTSDSYYPVVKLNANNWGCGYTSTNCAVFDSYWIANGGYSWLATPTISLSGYTSATLSFNLINRGTGGFRIDISTNGGSSYTTLVSNVTTSSGNFESKTVDLASYLGQSNLKIRFYCTSNCGSSRCTNYAYLDNVGVSGTMCTAPSITTHPSNSSICTGNATSFSVTASGTATLNYQWKENGTNLSNSGVYSNVTTSTLNISNVAGLNGKQYTCYVSNGCGNVTSNAATLTVDAVPVAGTASVSSSSICDGASVTFSSAGTSGTQVFQYQFNGTGGTWTDWLAAPQTWNSAGYGNNTAYVRNKVTNGTCPAVYSSPCSVVINSLPSPAASNNGPICAGNNLDLSVGSFNNYNWTGPNGFTSTTQNPSIPSATTAASGTYTVTVTGSNGCQNTSTTSATVNPTGAASVSINATASTICTGTNVTFTATPTNGGTPTYQWKVNGGNVGTNSSAYSSSSLNNNDAVICLMTSSNACVTGSPATSNQITMTVNAYPTVNITGTTSICQGNSTTLTASGGGTYLWNNSATTASINVSPSSTTPYSVTVTTNGCSTTNSATVSVGTSPSITSQPGSASKCTGQSVTFSVTVSGAGINYQWRKNGTDISGATNNNYTISSVASGDAGNYTCYISNGCGNITSNVATLSVNVSTSITSQPSSVLNTTQSSCSFTVGATGTGLSYQWQLSINGGSSWSDISAAGSNPVYSGYTSATLNLTGITQTCNGYQYHCIATGTCNTVTSNAAILTLYCIGGTYSFSGYSEGQTYTGNSYTYTTGIMSVKVSKGGPNTDGNNNGGYTSGGGYWNTEGFCDGGPNAPKYAPRYITSGHNCCSGAYEYTGLLLNCDWQNLTSTVTVDITFSTPVCAPLSFNIYDINTWQGTGTGFSDVVVVSAKKPDGTTLYPSASGYSNGNVYQSAGGTNGTGGANNASGTLASNSPSGTSGNDKTAVTFNFSTAGIAISSIKIIYTTNSTIPTPLKATDPTWEYIIIGEISTSSPTLPVELSEFSGKCYNGTIKLGWITASETNNDHFDIEKSSDGTEFYSIGTVEGNGNSNSILSYSFSDNSGSCTSGCYYRLKQVDYNGDHTYSKIIKVDCSLNDDDNFINIYPNPANDILNIALMDNSADVLGITIYNSMGELVYSTSRNTIKGSNFFTLPTDNLSKGIYTVVLNHTRISKTEKLLISR